jgi:hypothetical protein
MKIFFSVVVVFATLLSIQTSAAQKSTATQSHSKDWNISTPAIVDLFGYGLMLQRNIASGWSLGLSVASVSWSPSDQTAINQTIKNNVYSLRGDYNFSGESFQSGWYLAGSVASANVKVTETVSGIDYEGTASATGISLVGGYTWVWENFNIILGVGFSTASTSDITVKDSVGNTTKYTGSSIPSSALEFNLGWAF